MSSREPMNAFILEYLREMNHSPSKVEQEPRRGL